MASCGRMMIVALILALGFTVLVLLALYLCVVISFAPPILWPSWQYRSAVAAVACALIATAYRSTDGSLGTQAGLHHLTAATSELGLLIGQVERREVNLSAAALALSESLGVGAACAGCLGNASAWSNTTRELCAGLSAGPRVFAHVQDFSRAVGAGRLESSRMIDLVDASSGWEVWAAMMPMFAMTVTAVAVIVGAIAGRRNLLLLAQVGAFA